MQDFWFRSSPTDAFHSRSYGQQYSQVDSEIIRPRSSFWDWGYFLRAAVCSERIDLMVRGQDSKRPTSDWVSDKLSHAQRLSETVLLQKRLPSQPSSPQQSTTTSGSSLTLCPSSSSRVSFGKFLNDGPRDGKPADTRTPSVRTEDFPKNEKEAQRSGPPIPNTPQTSTVAQSISTLDKTGVGQNPQTASNPSFGQSPISIQPSALPLLSLPLLSHCTSSILYPSSIILPKPVSLARERPTLSPPPQPKPTPAPAPRPTGWFQTFRKKWL
jgi:hypothetical protein